LDSVIRKTSNRSTTIVAKGFVQGPVPMATTMETVRSSDFKAKNTGWDGNTTETDSGFETEGSEKGE